MTTKDEINEIQAEATLGLLRGLDIMERTIVSVRRKIQDRPLTVEEHLKLVENSSDLSSGLLAYAAVAYHVERMERDS